MPLGGKGKGRAHQRGGKGKGPPRGLPTLPKGSRAAQQLLNPAPPRPANSTAPKTLGGIAGFDFSKLKHRETKEMNVDLTAMQQLEKDATKGWAENTAEKWEAILRPYTVPNYVVPMTVAECQAMLEGCKLPAHQRTSAVSRLTRLGAAIDTVIAAQGLSEGVFMKDGIRSPKDQVGERFQEKWQECIANYTPSTSINTVLSDLFLISTESYRYVGWPCQVPDQRIDYWVLGDAACSQPQRALN